MKNHELSYAADRLLSQVPRKPDEPHYVEDTFQRKLQLAWFRDPRAPEPPRDPTNTYLLQTEWADIFRRAKLTARQQDVVRLRIQGKTFEEIGNRTGCSKQAVLNVLKQAAKKIVQSMESYPYSGISEVYRDELKKKGSHGGPGKLGH